MTLVSATKSELFPSIPNNFWYRNMWLNYTATLQGVSEGSHQLRIDVKPDSIRTRSISSSQEKPVVYFNVIGQPSTTAPASDSFLPLANALVVSASAGVIAVAAVVYLKKRKR